MLMSSVYDKFGVAEADVTKPETCAMLADPQRSQTKLGGSSKYGEVIEEGDAVQDRDWPKGAQRSRDYFAEEFNLADPSNCLGMVSEHRFVLQYAFDDGQPLTAARASVANS